MRRLGSYDPQHLFCSFCVPAGENQSNLFVTNLATRTELSKWHVLFASVILSFLLVRDNLLWRLFGFRRVYCRNKRGHSCCVFKFIIICTFFHLAAEVNVRTIDFLSSFAVGINKKPSMTAFRLIFFEKSS